jgi:hypothetical protein
MKFVGEAKEEPGDQEQNRQQQHKAYRGDQRDEDGALLLRRGCAGGLSFGQQFSHLPIDQVKHGQSLSGSCRL